MDRIGVHTGNDEEINREVKISMGNAEENRASTKREQ